MTRQTMRKIHTEGNYLQGGNSTSLGDLNNDELPFRRVHQPEG